MTDPEDRRRLEEMREVAFRLGMAFGQGAEQTEDLDRKLKLFEAFHQCFASVRLAIALDLRLRKTPAEVAARETERPEALEREPLEIERAERLEYTERDRDRETERASFPLLLRKLEHIAGQAEQLLPQAAELPTLRELLAQVKAQPPADIPLRSRLAGSATALLARPSGTPFRRATGPP
jgi:hypothetical protein